MARNIPDKTYSNRQRYRSKDLFPRQRGPELFHQQLQCMGAPGLSRKLAMKLGGEDRPEWVQPRHWERFADTAGLKRRYVQDRVRDMASRIVPLAEQLQSGFEGPTAGRETVGRIVEGIRRRAGAMSAN